MKNVTAPVILGVVFHSDQKILVYRFCEFGESEPQSDYLDGTRGVSEEKAAAEAQARRAKAQRESEKMAQKSED
jgi:hypothetical protein